MKPARFKIGPAATSYGSRRISAVSTRLVPRIVNLPLHDPTPRWRQVIPRLHHGSSTWSQAHLASRPTTTHSFLVETTTAIFFRYSIASRRYGSVFPPPPLAATLGTQETLRNATAQGHFYTLIRLSQHVLRNVVFDDIAAVIRLLGCMHCTDIIGIHLKALRVGASTHA